MSAPAHLNDTALQALELSDNERIQRIKSPRWIGYPTAIQLLNKMEDLLHYPPTHRMPNLLIVGESNNGKTMLLNRFCSLHPAEDNPNGDGIVAPVIYIESPPVPDEGRFYSEILDMLFAPYKTSSRADDKERQVIRLLKSIGTRILIIDEIHHLLAGSMSKQKAFLNVIKHLGNRLQASIIASGTKDAFRAVQTDPQLSNRFKPALLPTWQFGTDFRRLLISFERMIPLKNPSNLQEPGLAMKLHSMCEGNIGELSNLLIEAAVLAVKSGSECITDKELKAIGWASPSERKKVITRTR